jgi:hypothetical protein
MNAMWEPGIARYSLAVPELSNADESGMQKDLTWMLPRFLQALAKAGYTDSTVRKHIDGVWTDPNTGQAYAEPMTWIDLDVEDTPDNDLALHTFAAEVARATGQHKLYFNKIPLPRMLVDPAPSRQFGLPHMDEGGQESPDFP